MNLLLVVLLSLLFIVIYLLNGRKILSVSFISCGVFLLSAIVLLAFEKSYFNYVISSKTVFVICFSIVCLFVGEFIAKGVTINVGTKSQNYEIVSKPFYVSKLICISVFLLGLLIAVLDYYYLYQYSLTQGNPGEIWNAIAYTRVARVNSTDFNLPRILSYTGIVIKAFSYICFFFFAYNIAFHKKIQLRLMLPLISYCLIYFSSTERLGYLEIVSVCLVISLVLFGAKHKWKPAGNLKVLIRILLIIIATLFVFFLLGSFSGKTLRHGFSETICKYLGSAIVGLDSYLKYPWESNAIPGEQTLYSFYYLLKAIGFNIPITKSFLPFFEWANGSSNIYTCLVAPIQDYGIALTFITRIAIGFFYGFWTKYIETKAIIRNSPVLIVVFSMFYYPVAISCVSDLYLSFIQLNYIYLFIALAVLKLVFVNKRQIRLVRSFA